MYDIDNIMEEHNWPLHPRKQYMDQLRALKDAPFIKAITGLRRTGKSTLMDMFRSELMASNIDPKDIFYINLEEDDENTPRDHRALTDLVRSNI